MHLCRTRLDEYNLADQEIANRVRARVKSLPPDERKIGERVVQTLAELRQDGEKIVHDVEVRLIAEALGCVPADLGDNCPELCHYREADRSELVALNVHRLAVLLAERRERRKRVHSLKQREENVRAERRQLAGTQ